MRAMYLDSNYYTPLKVILEKLCDRVFGCRQEKGGGGGSLHMGLADADLNSGDKSQI